jgi:hypothetical protein
VSADDDSAAAAPTIEVSVDAAGGVHVHAEFPSEAPPEGADEDTPPAVAEEVPDVVGQVLDAAGQVVKKTAGAIWDVVKPQASGDSSEDN